MKTRDIFIVVVVVILIIFGIITGSIFSKEDSVDELTLNENPFGPTSGDADSYNNSDRNDDYSSFLNAPFNESSSSDDNSRGSDNSNFGDSDSYSSGTTSDGAEDSYNYDPYTNGYDPYANNYDPYTATRPAFTTNNDDGNVDYNDGSDDIYSVTIPDGSSVTIPDGSSVTIPGGVYNYNLVDTFSDYTAPTGGEIGDVDYTNYSNTGSSGGGEDQGCSAVRIVRETLGVSKDVAKVIVATNPALQGICLTESVMGSFSN